MTIPLIRPAVRVHLGVLATVVVVAVLVAVVAFLVVRRIRVARTVAALDGAWFAGPVVVVSPGVLGTTVLVADDRGLRLLWPTGGERAAWPWSEVFGVRADRIRYRAGLRWPGAVVDLEAGSRLDLLFLPGAGIGVSRGRTRLAVAAVQRGISAHRGQAGAPGPRRAGLVADRPGNARRRRRP